MGGCKCTRWRPASSSKPLHPCLVSRARAVVPAVCHCANIVLSLSADTPLSHPGVPSIRPVVTAGRNFIKLFGCLHCKPVELVSIKNKTLHFPVPTCNGLFLTAGLTSSYHMALHRVFKHTNISGNYLGQSNQGPWDCIRNFLISSI